MGFISDIALGSSEELAPKKKRGFIADIALGAAEAPVAPSIDESMYPPDSQYAKTNRQRKAMQDAYNQGQGIEGIRAAHAGEMTRNSAEQAKKMSEASGVPVEGETFTGRQLGLRNLEPQAENQSTEISPIGGGALGAARGLPVVNTLVPPTPLETALAPTYGIAGLKGDVAVGTAHLAGPLAAEAGEIMTGTKLIGRAAKVIKGIKGIKGMALAIGALNAAQSIRQNARDKRIAELQQTGEDPEIIGGLKQLDAPALGAAAVAGVTGGAMAGYGIKMANNLGGAVSNQILNSAPARKAVESVTKEGIGEIAKRKAIEAVNSNVSGPVIRTIAKAAGADVVGGTVAQSAEMLARGQNPLDHPWQLAAGAAVQGLASGAGQIASAKGAIGAGRDFATDQLRSNMDAARRTAVVDAAVDMDGNPVPPIYVAPHGEPVAGAEPIRTVEVPRGPTPFRDIDGNPIPMRSDIPRNPPPVNRLMLPAPENPNAPPRFPRYVSPTGEVGDVGVSPSGVMRKIDDKQFIPMRKDFVPPTEAQSPEGKVIPSAETGAGGPPPSVPNPRIATAQAELDALLQRPYLNAKAHSRAEILRSIINGGNPKVVAARQAAAQADAAAVIARQASVDEGIAPEFVQQIDRMTDTSMQRPLEDRTAAKVVSDREEFSPRFAQPEGNEQFRDMAAVDEGVDPEFAQQIEGMADTSMPRPFADRTSASNVADKEEFTPRFVQPEGNEQFRDKDEVPVPVKEDVPVAPEHVVADAPIPMRGDVPVEDVKPWLMTKKQYAARPPEPLHETSYKTKKEAQSEIDNRVAKIEASENAMAQMAPYRISPSELYVPVKNKSGEWGVGVTHKHHIATAIQRNLNVNGSAAAAYGIPVPSSYAHYSNSDIAVYQRKRGTYTEPVIKPRPAAEPKTKTPAKAKDAIPMRENPIPKDALPPVLEQAANAPIARGSKIVDISGTDAERSGVTRKGVGKKPFSPTQRDFVLKKLDEADEIVKGRTHGFYDPTVRFSVPDDGEITVRNPEQVKNLREVIAKNSAKREGYYRGGPREDFSDRVPKLNADGSERAVREGPDIKQLKGPAEIIAKFAKKREIAPSDVTEGADRLVYLRHVNPGGKTSRLGVFGLAVDQKMVRVKGTGDWPFFVEKDGIVREALSGQVASADKSTAAALKKLEDRSDFIVKALRLTAKGDNGPLSPYATPERIKAALDSLPKTDSPTPKPTKKGGGIKMRKDRGFAINPFAPNPKRPMNAAQVDAEFDRIFAPKGPAKSGIPMRDTATQAPEPALDATFAREFPRLAGRTAPAVEAGAPPSAPAARTEAPRGFGAGEATTPKEAMAKAEAGITYDKNTATTKYGAFDRFKANMFDDLRPLEVAQNKAVKKGMLDFRDDPENAPYQTWRKLAGGLGRATDTHNTGVRDWNTGEVIAPPLRDVEAMIEPELWPKFDGYMMAKRNFEDALEMRGIEQGMTMNEARLAVEGYEADYPQFKKASERFQQTNRAVLKVVKDSGLHDDAMVEALDEAGKAYVSLKKMLEGDEVEMSSHPSEGLTAADIRHKLKGSKRKVQAPTANTLENWMGLLAAADHNNAKRLLADLADYDDTFVTKFGTERPETGGNIMSYKVDGKTHYARLDPFLYEAMNSRNAAQRGMISSILGGMAQVYRTGVIFNPEYVVRNAMRDSVTASIIAAKNSIPGLYYAKGIVPSMRAMVAELRGKPMPKVVSDWMFHGGDQGMEMGFYADKSAQNKAIQRDGKLSPLQKGMMSAKSAGDAIQLFVQHVSERPTRIGYFKSIYDDAIKRGLSEKQAGMVAAYEARNLMDFALGGMKTKKFKRSAAFFGSQLAGMYREAEALKDPRAWARAAVYVTAPTLLLEYALRDNKQYQDMKDWKKDVAWWIPIPGSDGAMVPIPRPPGPIGLMFGTIPSRIARALKGDDKAWDGMLDIVARESIPNPIPTGVRPPMEQFFNRTLFPGGPIVGRQYEDLPSDLQANSRTSLTARRIGEATGFSPMRTDHLVRSVTGPLGTMGVAQITDRVARREGEALPNPDRWPGRKFFYGQNERESEALDRFYDRRTAARKGEARYRADGDKSERDRGYKRLEQHADYIADLRKRMDTATSPEEKTRLFEKIRAVALKWEDKRRRKSIPMRKDK